MPGIIGGIATLSETARNESIAVSTTSIVISDNRSASTIKRKDILVRNISPNTTDIISVAIGTVKAVANTGIVLRQNESFVFSTNLGNDCPQAQFSAICATATGLISIMER